MEKPELPIELIHLIIGFLPYCDLLHARQVCRTWYDVSISPPFLRRERIVIRRPNVDKIMCCLADHKNSKKTIFNFYLEYADISMDWNDFWIFFGMKIKSLVFKKVSCSPVLFADYCSMCPCLEHLEIIMCPDLLKEQLFSSEHVRLELQEKLKNVKSLGLGYNYDVSDSLFHRFLQIMPNIKSLKLSSNNIQCHSGIIKRFYHGKISSDSVPSSDVLTGSFIIMTLTKYGKSVEVLDLSHTCIDDNFVSRLVGIPDINLIQLNIAGCQEIKKQGYDYLFQRYTNMKHLTIGKSLSLNDSVISSMCLFLRSLKVLVMIDCNEITDDGLVCLKKLKSLHQIKIVIGGMVKYLI